MNQSALDDAERLRIGADGTDREAARTDLHAVGGAPSMVATTYARGTYPTVAAAFYACHPAAVLGNEVEGGAGTVATRSGTILALNLGGTIPPSGTQVVVTYVPNRWVFRHG